MDKELKLKIAEETAKHNWDKAAKKILPHLEKNSYLHTWKKKHQKRLVFELKKTPVENIKSILQEILKELPATNKKQVISTAGESNYRVGLSPFRFDFDNGVNSNHAKITYQSNDIEVDIVLPIHFYSDRVKQRGTRGVTDCEYHYYGGTSMSEIRNIRLSKYSLIEFPSVSWFGGDVTHIPLKKGEVKKFEYVIFNGDNP